MPIPLCDLQSQYIELKDELDAALLNSACAGQYIMGPNVRALESEISAYLGCQYAIAVGSGTDALHLSLRAMGVGVGDEVITTPFTFIATTEAIQMVGAVPVFVDIEADTYNIDAAQIERAITKRTKAILPVHLYGRPCEMDQITGIAEAHQLRIIEDCAQSLGAKYRNRHTGTIGDAGCLSFFPSKNLGCMGDGGMIVTNDREVYQQAEMLRRHGGKVKYHHTVQGVNSRLDDLQAAILRVKLPRLQDWNKRRCQAAKIYDDSIDLGLVQQKPLMSSSDHESVFHQYTLLTSHRDEFRQAFDTKQIGHAIYYPVPLHLQEVNAYLGYRPGDFPHAEYAAAHCFSVPMSPHLSPDQQGQVVQTLADSIPIATTCESHV